MRLILYQPDIPQNTGTLLRAAACLGFAIDIIEPCGFRLDDQRLRRAGMDYLDHVTWQRHPSWDAYCLDRQQAVEPGRLVLLTTKASVRHTDFAFAADDNLLVGRESAGVPQQVRSACQAEVRIPMRPTMRSLNVALAATLVLGEALRQTGGFDSLN